MSHWTRDFAFDQLQKHLALIAAARGTNEADTRLRAIDTMLFDVLGWNKLDVDTESYCRAVGYYDYGMKCESDVRMILEAKQSEDHFLIGDADFPVGASSFKLLAQECPSADKALRQAISYAAVEGSQYAAITNGHQWLIALTFIQSQRVDERKVLVFESLDAISKKFRLFWDCFSPVGVCANRSYTMLLETRKAPPPSKLSQRITLYPAQATRNTLQDDLREVLGTMWEDIKREEDDLAFLKECYVRPETGVPALAYAKSLLERKLSSDEQVGAQVVSPTKMPKMLKDYSSEKPIVVLGDVGSGKTTFLNYLRKIEAPETLDKYIQIEINFLDRPSSAAEVADYIYAEIDRQLQKSPHKIDILDDKLTRGALNADLNRFKNSSEAKAHPQGTQEYVNAELEYINTIRSNRHDFFKRIFKHLRGSHKYSLALFFDNLDRRLQSIQDEAYLRASAIARDWASLVFLCLRPATFHTSSEAGVLDSVAPKLISITNARADFVLVRRLKFAKRYMTDSMHPSNSIGNVSTFLDCLIESFRQKPQLVAVFESVANGNTRDLIKYVYNFLTSLHLDTTLILNKYRGDASYRVPVHHALRALLFDNFMHYDPKRSRFVNLFDVQQADKREHFTRLATLSYMSTISVTEPAYGYARVQDIVNHLCQVGYTATHAIWTMHYLFDRKCLVSRDPIEQWSDDIKELRYTDLGKYHLIELHKKFSYIDAMIIDTPIIDVRARATITDTFFIRERLARSLTFIEYLDSCANEVLCPNTKQLWEEASKSLMNEMSAIQDRLDEQDADDTD